MILYVCYSVPHWHSKVKRWMRYFPIVETILSFVKLAHIALNLNWHKIVWYSFAYFKMIFLCTSWKGADRIWRESSWWGRIPILLFPFWSLDLHESTFLLKFVFCNYIYVFTYIVSIYIYIYIYMYVCSTSNCIDILWRFT